MGEVKSASIEEVPRVHLVQIQVEEDPWVTERYGRRHAPRIAPPEGETIACALKAPRGEACPGEVRDLSGLGLGVWVEADEAAALENAVRVQIYLSFPKDLASAQAGDVLEFDATIRRRSVHEDRLFLACEIEDGSSPAERAGRARLAAWVGERFARG